MYKRIVLALLILVWFFLPKSIMKTSLEVVFFFYSIGCIYWLCKYKEPL